MNVSEREFYEKYASGCMNGSGASCVCACPFNLEVGLFIDKIKIHSYSGAYRLYRENVVFPGIVSRICPAPCQGHCVFGGEAVRLPLLEKACVAGVKDKKPVFYNMPAKPARVAVVGAGLSGLACALKLCMKNYRVTIFERSGRIGGNLWDLLDLLDPDVFLDDIGTQFGDFSYDLQLHTEITDLGALDGFDAVYVATGSGGDGFGLADGMDRKSYGSAKPGFFLGGRLIGGSDMDAIEHGKIASFSIEKYLQIGKMDGVDTTYHTGQCRFAAPKAARKGCGPAVAPSDGELYNKEEVSAEAGRCLQCDCSACYDRCELMQSLRQYPVKMIKDAIVSMFPVPGLDGKRISTRVIGACLQCGACKDFCPSGIDMEKFFSDFRNRMAEEETLPPPFHDFFIQDFLFTEGGDARLARSAPDGKNSGYAFFPGCQLGGVVPEAVEKTYAFLLEKMPGTSIMMMCCGVPAHWGGQADLFREHLGRIREDWASLGKPTLILACVTCQKTFEASLPEIPTASLYEVLSGFISGGYTFPASAPGENAAVYDPCSSRRKADIQQSVRSLARSAGYAIQELENHGGEAECCGYGGHTHFAKTGYTEAIAAKRAKGSNLPYLVYCANCRESFTEKGKECRHILEALFGVESRRDPVTKTDRRQNRRRLKADMLKEFWGEAEGGGYSPYDRLAIHGDLREKMSRNYIVADDILKAIQEAEESGRVIYHPDTHVRIAHLRVGGRTYWSKYIKDADGGYELVGAYSHRLNIEE